MFEFIKNIFKTKPTHWAYESYWRCSTHMVTLKNHGKIIYSGPKDQMPPKIKKEWEKYSEEVEKLWKSAEDLFEI